MEVVGHRKNGRMRMRTAGENDVEVVGHRENGRMRMVWRL